ncbi:MAG: DUF3108 domain-containing protein [Bdellovibrionia bacterium]
MYRNCRAKIAGVVGTTLLVIGGTVGMNGCVSGSVKQIQTSNELPPDLPPELRKRFDYKEAASLLKGSDEGLTAERALASDQQLDGRDSTRVGKSKKRKNKKLAGKFDTDTANADKLSAVPFVYPTRRPAQDPIWQAERLTYGISYLGVGAGELTMEVLPFKTMANRKVYHVRGNAVSSSVFSLFYSLNDVIESFIDYEGLFSHRFHLVLDESKQKRDSLELNDSEKQQTYYWDRVTRTEQPLRETKKFSPIQPFSQDSISALYYLRTVPLTIGAIVTIPVVSEGNTWDAVCTVLRREVVGSPLGDISALVIKPEMKYQGVLKKSGDSFLWLTDDDRRIPLRLEAKVRIGYVVANLKRVELGTPPATLAPSPSTK